MIIWGSYSVAASLCPNPCLSTRIAWNLFWGRDEINGTFYWCRSCLWCCGIVMKKNVEGMLRRWNIKMPPAGSRSAAEGEISPSWWELDQNKSWLMGVWMCLHVCLLIEYVQARACTRQDIYIQMHPYEHMSVCKVSRTYKHSGTCMESCKEIKASRNNKHQKGQKEKGLCTICSRRELVC